MRGVPETIEITQGDALRVRVQRQNTFKNPGTLGPHDLCTVVKVGRKNSFIGRLSDVAGGGPTGAYHFVSGADVGSVAAVAAYFYDLIQRQETTTLWEGGMARTISSGTFCIWNAFRHVDLRVEFKVPGKTRVYVIDADAPKTYPPDEQIWKECRVSSILRGMSLFRKKTIVSRIPREIYNMPFRTFNPVADRDKMQSFLQDVIPLFQDSKILGSPSIHLNNRLGELPAAGRLCIHIYLIMIGRGQYGDCVEFFSSLVLKFPLVVVYIAALCEAMGELKRGMNLLCAILSQNDANDPLYSSILAAQIMLLLDDVNHELDIIGGTNGEEGNGDDDEKGNDGKKRKKLEYAILIGKKLVTLQPYTYSAWILLAKAYILSGDFPNGLIALNTAPLRYSDRAAQVLQKDPSQLALSSWTFDFAFSSQGGLDGKWRKRFSIDNFVSLNFAAYDLLVIIESAIGWNGFLNLRNSVFITDVDVVKNKEEEMGMENPKEEEEVIEIDIGGLAIEENDRDDNDEEAISTTTTTSSPLKNDDNNSSTTIDMNNNINNNENGDEDEEEETNDDNGLSLERHLYEGTEPTILYTGRPRPCQPTLDALIGILYKDVHAFAVWIHEDHDDLLQNYDEEETDDIENNSNSEMEDNEQVEEEEENNGNDSNTATNNDDDETKNDIVTDETVVKIQHQTEEEEEKQKEEVVVIEKEEGNNNNNNNSTNNNMSNDDDDDAQESSSDSENSSSSSSSSSSDDDSNGSSQPNDDSSNEEHDVDDESGETALTRGICVDKKPKHGTKEEKQAYKYLKLGYLFCRLQYYDLAFHILHKCVGLAYSLDAWEAILLLSTHIPNLVKDSLSTAMLSIVQILLSIDEHEDSTDLNDTHPFIREALITMIGKKGLTTVRNAVARVEAKFTRQAKNGVIELSTEKIKLVASRIDNSLRDAVKWRSKGYNQ